jgi:hypothetical protein
MKMEEKHSKDGLGFSQTRRAVNRGFPLMVGATLVAFIVVALLALPRGPIVVVERRITLLDGINGIVWVTGADGRAVRVHLPMRHHCGVGDRIQLSERRTLWGQETKVALVPQPCRR